MKTLANETFSRPFSTGSMANFLAYELSLGNKSTTSFYGKFWFICSESMIPCLKPKFVILKLINAVSSGYLGV